MVTRNAMASVEAALADTRVVVILGARQVGKSTLLEQVAAGESPKRELLTLDNQAVRESAAADPAGFIAGLETPVAIDEVQRVTELMTEIKLRVDRDGVPGQFIITGSANLLEMSQVKESLAGRSEYLRLHPFSQGELRGVLENFVPGLRAGRFPKVVDAPVGSESYAEMITKGGYPEVQRRPANRRARFFESYIEGILERDLAGLAGIADRSSVRRLLQAVGATSSCELNIEALSSDLGTPASTLKRHIELLEILFLVRRLPAWSNNLLSRTIKRPKIYVADTGLLAYLIGANERRLGSDADVTGKMLETFVAMELTRQISWLDDRPELHHFRDRDKREVDIVMEHRDGSVTAVEVKAAATVRERDLRGLVHLRDKLGDRFKAGALVYTGAHTVPFGDRLAAVPLAGLWGG